VRSLRLDWHQPQMGSFVTAPIITDGRSDLLRRRSMRSICQALTADHCSLVHMRVALFRVCVSRGPGGKVVREPKHALKRCKCRYIFITYLVRYVNCPQARRSQRAVDVAPQYTSSHSAGCRASGSSVQWHLIPFVRKYISASSERPAWGLAGSCRC
jgi:hypothetical protein